MDRARILTRSRFALAALLYAFAVVYSSTVVGRTGLHFVPLDIEQAWDQFLRTPYLINGSDQRADWMANLVMLVPMGFLVGGALRSDRACRLRGINAALAFALCLVFVLAVKFLQLFFPSRTVSLNYIMAQSLGSALGVIMFWSLRQKIMGAAYAADMPKLVLIAYAFAYVLFTLAPLNFTLSAGDLHERLRDVPHLLLSWPGTGRSHVIRLVLVLANFLAAVPLGVLLAIKARKRSARWYIAISLILMSTIVVLKIFVMSATPYLASIGFTTAGMFLGVCFEKWAPRTQMTTLPNLLQRSLPLLVPLYFVAVLAVNGLLSWHWRSPEQAWESLDPRGLMPFWNWYIVSKAHAAQSLAVHAIMFAPVGIMLSLRRPGRAGDVCTAATLAFLFALLVELGRWFLPGMAPDFYEALVAAFAAGGAVPLTRLIWRNLEGTSEANDARVSEHGVAAGHPNGNIL